MENIDQTLGTLLEKLAMSSRAQGMSRLVKTGVMSLEDFDGWFAELVRAEIGKTLGIVRNKAIAKARGVLPNDKGNAATAILRRTYKDGRGGNINILGNSRRMSNKQRVVDEPSGGVSGKRRVRTIKDRTQQINSYYGPDRAFILRMLEYGTDVRMAKADGAIGRGSKATYGRRGAIAARSFFHTLGADMEEAAQQMGQTLVNNVEQFINKKISE